ncbi:MAG: SRPBCC family protein [Rhodanobacter sp.]|jgi:hypothetical protein|nr:SRPBCC family protein [Rhodanobacter sp.]
MLPRHAAAPAALLLIVCASAAAASPLSRTRRFHLDATCQRILPLLTARGEEQWAQGWHPELLSGDRGRGSVFRTRRHDGHETVWIVTDDEPAAGRISYARLAGGSNMGLVDVRCSGDGEGSTVQVSYTLTGLNPEGRAYASEFLADARYGAMMAEWKQALTAALARGGG